MKVTGMKASTPTTTRRVLILLPLVGLLAGCPVMSPSPEGKIQHLKFENGSKYSVYVPTWYTPKEKWPLVISLHGTFGYDDQRRQAKEVAFLADEYGFIVAAPGLRSVQGILPVKRSLWRKDLQRDREKVLELIDLLASQYSIDRTHVLLTGFSAGGFVMWDAGVRHPDRFQMLIGRSVNFSVNIMEDIEATPEARNMPILIFWGRDDPASGMGWDAYEYLRSHGFFSTERRKIEGGHWRHPRICTEAWRERWSHEHLTRPKRLGRKPVR